MSDFVAVENFDAVLSGQLTIPTITMWNRLEGRPRRHEFDRALKARIRDPLWMLCKQWQMGEFKGDDAGSPITAKVHIDTTQLTKYQPTGHAAEAFADDVPLEAKVEQRPLGFHAGEQIMSIDIRAEMGRRWLKLVPGTLREDFIAAVGFAQPDPSDAAHAGVCAHPEAWQEVAALAGRAMDGYALYEHLRADPNHHAHDLIVLANPADAAVIEAAEATFLDWYAHLFYQPSDDSADAWQSRHLEYAFAVSAPQDDGEKQMLADEYFHGHLDWYNLDHADDVPELSDVADAPLPEDVQDSMTSSFLPTPISFAGMPNTRWWTFEEGKTNFGDIDPDTTDINKLLVMEFGQVYANDWFLLPFTVPAGTLSRVRGLTVTNVFGERTWVEAGGRGDDQDWQRWSMYTLSTRGEDQVPADQSLLMLPSVPKIQEGRPVEAVQMIRDEVANMVWGIETRVPLPTGTSKSGRTAARQTRRYYKRLVEESLGAPPEAPELIENDAAIHYNVMTRVAENWIPFVPVHVEGSNREIQLRRAAMPRLIDGDPDPPEKVRPRTRLLREGLEQIPLEGYDIHEEEVRRAGVRIGQSFQRTRWYGGDVFLWLGVRKKTGRGERSSGLRFDQI